MQSYIQVQKKANIQNKAETSSVSRLNQQKQLEDINKILIQFDYNPKYGPSMGLTRKQRYERAEYLGLNPPRVIKEFLMKLDQQSQICNLDQNSFIA